MGLPSVFLPIPLIRPSRDFVNVKVRVEQPIADLIPPSSVRFVIGIDVFR